MSDGKEEDAVFDIDAQRKPWEIDDHWMLRRDFLSAHVDKFPPDRLLCLAQLFVNIETMGTTYPAELMKLIRELSADVESLTRFRERKSELEAGGMFKPTKQPQDTNRYQNNYHQGGQYGRYNQQRQSYGGSGGSSGGQWSGYASYSTGYTGQHQQRQQQRPWYGQQQSKYSGGYNQQPAYGTARGSQSYGGQQQSSHGQSRYGYGGYERSQAAMQGGPAYGVPHSRDQRHQPYQRPYGSEQSNWRRQN